VTLGVVQGLTEFLPVSSSAHLDFIPKLLGWGDPGAAFTAVIQLGTTVAVVAYFWKDLVPMAQAFLNTLRPGADRSSLSARLGWAVVYGTIPAAVIGLLLEKKIDRDFRDLRITATMLIVMGIALWAADQFAKKTRTIETITTRDGWLVGAAQCLALIPGASRSGSTLIGAFLSGLDRPAAARFSFLLSVPVIVLSGLYKLKDLFKPHVAEPGMMSFSKADMAIATVVAGIVGYASIAFLMRYLRTHTTLVFVIYRVIVGALLLYLISTNHLAPQ
jgi:undecaprenyl-diphosphatase